MSSSRPRTGIFVALVTTMAMALAVPPDAAPGEYVLLLGLYDPVTGVRRTVRSFVEDPRDPPLPRTDALEVGRVRIRNR